jgi:hypothetical protein
VNIEVALKWQEVGHKVNINYIASSSLALWPSKNFGLLYNVFSVLYYMPSDSIHSALVNIPWMLPYQSGSSGLLSVVSLDFAFCHLNLYIYIYYLVWYYIVYSKDRISC